MSAANTRPYATRSRVAAAAAVKTTAPQNTLSSKVNSSAALPTQPKRALGDITNSIAQREQQQVQQRSQLGKNANISVKDYSVVASSVALTSSNQSTKLRRTASLKPSSGAATRRDLQRRALQVKKQQDTSQHASQNTTTSSSSVQSNGLSKQPGTGLLRNSSHPTTSKTLPSATASSVDVDENLAPETCSLDCQESTDELDSAGNYGDSPAHGLGSAQVSFTTQVSTDYRRRPAFPPGVVDIDAQDSHDPLSVSEFAREIFENHRAREHRFMVPASYMDDQQDITNKMRAILVDWLVDVHQKFKLSPETLHLTVNIIDRFLAVTQVKRRKLQLVGVTAMLIASKYEEIYAPETADFVYISDKAYDRDEILHMEAVMLNVLKFEVTVPTSLAFLNRYVKASKARAQTNTWALSVDSTMGSLHSSSLSEAFLGSNGPGHYGSQVSSMLTCAPAFSETAEHFALYLLELCLQSASMLAFPASVRAATSCMIAAKLFTQQSWTPTMQYYSGDLQPEHLYECETAMRALFEAEQSGHATNKLTAIKRKFGSTKYGEISSLAIKIYQNSTDYASTAAFERMSSSDYTSMDICCEEDSV